MHIKKTIYILFTVLLFSGAAYASEFCDGFKEGYKEGYCDGKFSCLKPLPLLCPLPALGEKTFRDGYNRGFKTGIRASK